MFSSYNHHQRRHSDSAYAMRHRGVKGSDQITQLGMYRYLNQSILISKVGGLIDYSVFLEGVSVDLGISFLKALS